MHKASDTQLFFQFHVCWWQKLERNKIELENLAFSNSSQTFGSITRTLPSRSCILEVAPPLYVYCNCWEHPSDWLCSFIICQHL